MSPIWSRAHPAPTSRLAHPDLLGYIRPEVGSCAARLVEFKPPSTRIEKSRTMTNKSHHETEATPPKTVPDATPEQAVPTEPLALDPRDVELAMLKDRLLRLQADFDNFRKRTLRDREDMARRAAEKILKELLPVIDHFDLGIQAARKSHIKHAVMDGFEEILKQFLSLLEKSGVTPIETRGQVFDPHIHECVTQIPSEEHPESMVIEETRRGYRLGTYVLRASQVIVSSGPAPVADPVI
jgi:molecular chaperone GrpE